MLENEAAHLKPRILVYAVDTSN
ncbi:uncharacterized protein METZ01_LOCUS500742 [marine metagenome]|uniref:Uncharacterized protein n=1 Tax=marine metagenome TaxID=408172 RepID=A0A383DVL5_9ZZZZ